MSNEIENTNHQTPRQIVVIQQNKSMATAVILSLFFGPLGLLYTSVIGAIVMFLINIPVFFLTAGFGLILTNIICVIWAVISVNSHNAKSEKQARGIQ